MIIGLPIKILPRKPRIIGELDPIPVHVFVGEAETEGVRVPAPQHIVRAGAHRGNHPERIQVVRVDVLDAGDGDRRRGGIVHQSPVAAEHRHGDIAQVNGLLLGPVRTVVIAQ